MKILVLNYEYPPVGGGGATVSAQLCGQLAQRGHEVDVITMHFDALPREERDTGVGIYRTPAYRRRADRCHIPEMASYLLGGFGPATRLARERRYDIMHAHFILPTSPLAWWVRKQTGIPYVLTCHGSDVPGHNPHRFRRAHQVLLPVWKRLIGAADLLISPSESLKGKILRHCPQADIRIVPNGFDIRAFEPDRPKRQSILLCGRLVAMKGFHHVLDAARDLQDGWEIHIAGDGPCRAAMEEQARSCRAAVHFHGWLDRRDPMLRELYETCAIFAFPAEAENFPTVLLEAMAAGAAILTSTAGGCPEVVGEAALLTPPNDPNAIKLQLMRLIESESLRCELSRAARRRAERFTWPAIAEQHEALFEEVIERSRVR